MNILNKLRDFVMKLYRRVRRSLSKKRLIMILSALIAAAAAITLVIVFKINSSDNATSIANGKVNSAAGKDKASSSLSDDSYDEDIPVVETATEGTKVESTSDTTVLAKKEGAKEGYLNNCVFLGDSRTVAMVNYGFFNDDAVLAQIGISHPAFASNTFINNAGKEYTLKSYLESHQAPVIYIALGVNGINDPSEEHYKETFLTLIDTVAELAPNSNIVLMAIGPVDDNGSYKKTVQNEWIDKYNNFLLDTAKEKHIFFLNITEILKGSDGQVKREYDGGDGLHYSGSGCEAIYNYIVEHPVPGISDDGEYIVKYIKPDPNKIKVTMDDGSGIDKDNLKNLMDMMTEGPATDKSASSSTDVQIQQQKEQEEAQRKEEEERRAKEEAERKAEEEEEERKADEEADRKAREEEEARKAEEEAASKAAEEEAERKAKEEEAAKKAAEEEAASKAAEEEAARKAAEEEAARKAAEEEAARKAEEEAASKAAEEQNQPAEGGDSGQSSEGESSGESGEQSGEGGEN